MASTSNSEPPPPPPASEEDCRDWLELPPDVTAMILHKLGAIEILNNAQMMCTVWRNICKDPAMWRVIDMRNSGEIWGMTPSKLELMTNHAVDRSCGQLVDINIAYFGSSDLQYISNRSSKLKRLRFVCCYENLSSEAFEKLPLLEELHLYYTFLSKEDIEAVGRCCPLLMSFKLNQQGRGSLHNEYINNEYGDVEALAIAKNMPQLHNLDLFGNQMTNEGLQAILDNCLHLESLDLRQCFGVSLEGEFGKICSERIKDLKRPYDSTEGYGFSTNLDGFESEDDGYSDNDYEYEYCLSCAGSDVSDYESLFDD